MALYSDCTVMGILCYFTLLPDNFTAQRKHAASQQLTKQSAYSINPLNGNVPVEKRVQF